MIAVIQRCSEAAVRIDGNVKGAIGGGLVILTGIEDLDNPDDVAWLANKLVNMRIFDDADGVMNLSVKDTNGELLVISQFTLHASTKKGNRPSYIKAARPEKAIPLYEMFISSLTQLMGKPVQSGTFGADMQVSLINDGPVTIIVDTKNRT